MVTKNSGGTITHQVDYTYDVFNRRIIKSIDSDGAGSGTSTEERYLYDGDHIVLVYDETNQLTNRLLHGPAIDQVLADEQFINGLFDKILWPLTDHLGSVRDLVDNSGTIQNHIVYDSFGNILSETDSSVNHLFGYTGRETDEETDLYYYRNRYYDADVGRFISEDPIGFNAGDVNIVRYVGNFTTGAVDPSGLSAENPHLPADNRGTWISGKRGNGVFKFFDNEFNRERSVADLEVKFKDGYIAKKAFPAKYYYLGDPCKATVEIDEVLGRDSDFTAADEKMRRELKDPNWKRPDGYTWNHAGSPGDTTMELVDTDVHRAVAHEGNASGSPGRARSKPKLSDAELKAKRQANAASQPRVRGKFAVRGLVIFDVYFTAKDIMEAAGIRPEEVVRKTYYFRDENGIFYIQSGWLDNTKKYVSGARQGCQDTISSDTVAALKEEAKKRFGRWNPGLFGIGSTFIPGTELKRLPYTDLSTGETGYYDENGYHQTSKGWNDQLNPPRY